MSERGQIFRTKAAIDGEHLSYSYNAGRTLRNIVEECGYKLTDTLNNSKFEPKPGMRYIVSVELIEMPHPDLRDAEGEDS